MRQRVFSSVSILMLAVSFVNLGDAQAQSITPGQVVKWFDPFGDLTDSVITEDPNGNIGIGTTNPVGALDVSQNSSDAIFSLSSIGAQRWQLSSRTLGRLDVVRQGGGTPISITPGEYVGIGTLNPLAKLNVVTDGINQGVRAETDFQDAVVAISNNHIGVHGITNSFFYPGVRASSYQASPANLGLEVEGRFTATGTKNAVVPLHDGQRVLLAAEESTEVWFSDYGSTRLVNGLAVVQIDPEFLQTVNTTKDYHVFVTARGDPGGSLYIDNETPSSFEIRETSGSANIKVSYRIAAKRKDFADERLKKVEWSPQPEATQQK
jgi:hypothetical protein